MDSTKSNNFINRLDNVIFTLLIIYAFMSTISIAATNVVISLAALFGVVRWYKCSLKFGFDRKIIYSIGIFLMTVVVTGFFAYNPLNTIKETWGFSYRMFPMFLICAFIRDKNKINILGLALILSLLVSSIFAIWQGFHGNLRAPGFSRNAMILAGHLLQLIPLTLIICTGTEKIGLLKKGFLYCVLIISSAALFFNGTRGAWVSVAISLLIYAFFAIRKDKKFLMLIIIIVLLLSILIVSVPSFQERIISIGDMKDQSNAERLLLWQSSWRMFLDHPLTGVGAGNFKELYQSQYILPQAKQPWLGHAHNNFVHILAETGIFGIMSFVYMFGYIIVNAFRRYSEKASVWMMAVIIVTLSLLIQGLTEYNFDDSSVIRLYWFILGLAYVADNIKKTTMD